MEKLIKARSFGEAKRILKKHYHMEGDPVRIADTSLYRFVNPKRIKPIAKGLPISKVIKNMRDDFKY